MSAKINKNFTYVSVWSYPLAYPYWDDNFVAAATDDNPGSSPLLELLCFH